VGVLQRFDTDRFAGHAVEMRRKGLTLL